jgi:hypothetical protein
VTLSPVQAIVAGAKWRRVGTYDWLNSDATDPAIVPGTCSIEFKELAGWITPATRSVTVIKDRTVAATAIYQRPLATLQTTAPEPTSISPIPVTLTFSVPVSGFSAGELVVLNATVANFSGSGAGYSFNLIPTQSGTVGVALAGSTPLSRTFFVSCLTAWVNFAWAGTEIGSQAQPFNTLAEGVAAVLGGGTIKLVGPNASGEKLRIIKAMRLEAVTGAVRIGVNGVVIPPPGKQALTPTRQGLVKTKPSNEPSAAPAIVPVALSEFQVD